MAVTTTRKGFYKPDHITDNLRNSIDWFNTNTDNMDHIVYYDEDETVDGNWLFASGINVASGEYINYGAVNGSSGYGMRDLSGSIQFKNSGGSWVNMGGSVTPSGVTTNVQYNDGGQLGGATGLLYNNTTDVATIGAPTRGYAVTSKVMASGVNGLQLLEDSSYGITIVDTGDVDVKLGDALGVKKFTIQNSSVVDKFTIDSSGLIVGTALKTNINGAEVTVDHPLTNLGRLVNVVIIASSSVEPTPGDYPVGTLLVSYTP